MAAKNRNKNSSSSPVTDKAPVINQKNTKPVERERTQGASTRTGAGLWKLVSAVLVASLAAGVVIASHRIQLELSELREARERLEEAARRSEESGHSQIGSLKASLESIEAVLLITKADLDSTSQTVMQNQAETLRLEASLQNIKNQRLQDVQQATEAQKKGFLELDERLVQLSQSSAQISEEQGRIWSDLAGVKAHLDNSELLKQDLSNLQSKLVAIQTSSQENTAQAMAQITSLESQITTRNQELASLAQELAGLRTLLQSSTTNLREQVADIKVQLQTNSDQIHNWENTQDHLSEGLTTLQSQMSLQQGIADRVKAAEESLRDLEISIQKGLEDHAEGTHESLEELKTQLSVQQGLGNRVKAIEESLSDMENQKVFIQGLGVQLKATEESFRELETLISVQQGLKDQVKANEETLRELESHLTNQDVTVDALKNKEESHEVKIDMFFTEIQKMKVVLARLGEIKSMEIHLDQTNSRLDDVESNVYKLLNER